MRIAYKVIKSIAGKFVHLDKTNIMQNVNVNSIQEIATNAERLLADAKLLFRHGSPGTAMAIAILAFEEIGKGQVLEFGIDKTKLIRSWHQYRQVNAAFVLIISLFQKYDLEIPELSENTQQQLYERWDGTKTLAERFETPVTAELLEALNRDASGSLKKLNDDEVTIFLVELRWVKKLMIAASLGEIEKQRQRGMYIDLDDGNVSSNPAEVTSHEAYYRIQVAERALRIFVSGEFKEPYGELAAFLETIPKPLPPIEEIMDTVQTFFIRPYQK